MTITTNHTSNCHYKGIIAWFACNPVAANLLMIVIIVVGTYSAFDLRRTLLPSISSNQLSISIPYPGAAPEEVEKAILLKVEDALTNIAGIKRITTNAHEGRATAMLDIYDGDWFSF